MAEGARELRPMTFLNDGQAKTTIRDFAPHPVAAEAARLGVVPEPTVEEIEAVEVPVPTPEEEAAIAAELAAELAAGTPDPNSPPAAESGTPEGTPSPEAPAVPQPTDAKPKRGPAPA